MSRLRPRQQQQVQTLALTQSQNPAVLQMCCGSSSGRQRAPWCRGNEASCGWDRPRGSLSLCLLRVGEFSVGLNSINGNLHDGCGVHRRSTFLSTGPPDHGSTGSDQKESGGAASFSQVSKLYCISPPTGHGPPKIQRGCLRPYFPSSGSTIVPLRTGPPYRWNPRGLHVPTVGLQPPTLASILSTFLSSETVCPADWLRHRDDQKEPSLFLRSVIVTCISRLLDTDRYSVESDAHNFPSKSGTDAPRWRPVTPAGCAGGLSDYHRRRPTAP